MRGAAHGVNFLPAPRREYPAFLIGLPRYDGVGGRGEGMVGSLKAISSQASHSGVQLFITTRVAIE